MVNNPFINLDTGPVLAQRRGFLTGAAVYIIATGGIRRLILTGRRREFSTFGVLAPAFHKEQGHENHQ